MRPVRATREAMASAAHQTIVEVADYPAAQDYFFDNNLTDGLPVVPPTPDRVDAMLAAGGRAREHMLGTVEGRPNGLTVEQAAVSAVMAGALPAYFPVVLATWDAIFDPALNAMAVLGSSGGTAITAIVSGPFAAEIGMNSGHNVFGPGNRANATIGRSVRLGLMNGLGYRAGKLDGASFGTQARFGAHFAERPPLAPWLGLSVRQRFPARATTVTVAVTDAPRQIAHINSGDATNVAAMFGAAVRDATHCSAPRGGTWIFAVVGPEHEMILRDAGWSQEALAHEIARIARHTPDELRAAGVAMDRDGIPIGEAGRVAPGADGKFPMTTADKVLVTTAGGAGAGWSHVIFGYAPSRVFSPVVREVVA